MTTFLSKGRATTLSLSTALLLACFSAHVAPPYEALLEEVKTYIGFHFNHDVIGERAIISYARHSYSNYEQVLKRTDRSQQTHTLLQAFYCCLIVRHYRMPLAPLAALYGDHIPPLFDGVVDTPEALEAFIIEKAKQDA